MANEDFRRLTESQELNVRCPYCGNIIGTINDCADDFDEEKERLINKHLVSGTCLARRK